MPSNTVTDMCQQPEGMRTQLRTAGLMFSVAFGCAAVVFAVAVMQPLEWLLGVVPDDAFYYLKIATNIAQRGFSTFDGTNPTNGYHPAWMLCLVALAKASSDPVVLLKAAIVLSFVFHVAASALLGRALEQWLRAPIAWLGASLWLVNALPLQLAMQAVEASLYIFLLALSFLIYSRQVAPHLARDSRIPTRAFVSLGFSMALCFLGRTEAAILATVVTLALLGVLPRRDRVRGVFAIASPFAFLFLSWTSVSYLSTGAWFQRSGSMKMLWASARELNLAGRVTSGISYFASNWITYPVLGDLPMSMRGLRAATNLAVTLALLWGLRRAWRNGVAFKNVGLTLAVGTSATGFVYAFLFLDAQYWYKAQPGLLIFLIAFVCLAQAYELQWSVRLERLAMFAIVALASLSAYALSKPQYPWQRDVYTSQFEVERSLPPDARLGAFNAGIPGYFGQRPIVNLDGLVNNSSWPYYKSRTFDDYLRREGITHIADETSGYDRARSFMRKPPQLLELKRWPQTNWSFGSRYLWRVSFAGE